MITNKNKTDHYIKQGMGKLLINFLSSGLTLYDACVKLSISYHMGKRLLDYETHHNPVSYIKRDREVLFLDEMSYGNDSFRNLLIPYFEEKQTITKMSKV